MKKTLSNQVCFSIIVVMFWTTSPLFAQGNPPVTGRQGSKCAVVLGNLLNQEVKYIDDLRQELVAYAANWSSPVSSWMRQGVLIKASDIGMQDRRSLFRQPHDSNLREFERKLKANGLTVNRDWLLKEGSKSFPAIANIVLGFINEGQALKPEYIDNFTNKTGFAPTKENLVKYTAVSRTFLKGKMGAEVAIIFGPYAKIDSFEEVLARFPVEYRSAIEGIRTLINEPNEVIRLLQEVKILVRVIRNKNTLVTENEAIEWLRRHYEIKNGFVDEPIILGEILKGEAFRKVLTTGIMIKESSDTHSAWKNFAVARVEHTNIHRNLWLLVMIDMEKNPDRYGGPNLKARQIFEGFGNLNWLNSIWTAQPWYQLFDHISDRSGKLANVSNPFYFAELWTKVTGFSRSD